MENLRPVSLYGESTVISASFMQRFDLLDSLLKTSLWIAIYDNQQITIDNVYSSIDQSPLHYACIENKMHKIDFILKYIKLKIENTHHCI